ncbi:acyl-CoA dehydrogenase [Allosaccharopolyspora coralli]|uniref:Acyl-CoA dehydrogenase n=1 Tax=Allosaccharopolyspora coralli TaxID=2665642 RepID=A0A5Q3QFW8_9PSEU|nr:acyl-CoA dehydrogenase family protein [Allosaccharopolyspora coralli]QGK70359.1 acyl-CoA dehydrogenase [Allosaccharopolyspora coralli]
MDFSLTDAQQDLAGLTRRIVGDHATHERLTHVETGPDRHDARLWSALADAGVLAAALPQRAGGDGFGLLEQCSVLIELGHAVAPVPYTSTITTCASTLAEFGDERQQKTWLTPVLSGEKIVTAALTEPHQPHDAPLATRARQDDGAWILDGTKTSVPVGGFADGFLVPAQTTDGPAVFLLGPSDGGVHVERQEVVDGSSEAWLDLDGVRLDDDRRLDGEPDVLRWLRTRATVGVCAEQLGVLERALELTAEYATERVQFDRPIGSFQAVSQRLADAYIDVEAVRLTLWQAAWLASEGLPCAAETATAKFWAGEAGHRVAHTAVHVHGGIGIDVDHVLHRYFVAAKRAEFALGGATQQALHLGSLLARAPEDPR